MLIIVLVGVGAFLLGWWGSGQSRPGDGPGAVGTTGENTERAREIGAKVGERTADAADQARRAVADGSITGKIKAKMALDDTVKALDVDVDTNGSTVTVSGVVGSNAQRDRVLQLARETEGVTQVVDRVKVK
ncbi:MAG: BON domain-containing protein [Vicinamibacterales bacterium]